MNKFETAINTATNTMVEFKAQVRTGSHNTSGIYNKLVSARSSLLSLMISDSTNEIVVRKLRAITRLLNSFYNVDLCEDW